MRSCRLIRSHLQRQPVKKADVLDQFRELRNHEAVRIVQQIPERDGVLDRRSSR